MSRRKFQGPYEVLAEVLEWMDPSRQEDKSIMDMPWWIHAAMEKEADKQDGFRQFQNAFRLQAEDVEKAGRISGTPHMNDVAELVRATHALINTVRDFVRYMKS